MTGSTYFGDSVTLAAGSSTIEPGATPVKAVTLSWNTFFDASNQAGISRRFGGIHFEAADLNGRLVGRLVGQQALAKAKAYWSGVNPDKANR